MTKKLAWNQIPVKNLTKTTFWARANEGELENNELFGDLMEQFAAKSTAKGALTTRVPPLYPSMWEIIHIHANSWRYFCTREYHRENARAWNWGENNLYSFKCTG